MKTAKFLTLLSAALLCVTSTAHADTFGSGGNTFDIEFVTIGDSENAADTTGDPSSAGSVNYVYRIGKFEVSRDMMTKANAEGDLEITLDGMGFVTGGPRPDMPATGISWNEAARFVNWLNTSQGSSAAYKFGTQPGDVGYDANANIELWDAGDPGFDAANPFRNSLAQYVLPSVDEWYKAAFYDPNANGGTGGYWNYPTGSDSKPTPVDSGTDPGTAVYGQTLEQGPADITQAGGLSPYGTMAQAGSAWEWEETEFDLVNDDGSSARGVRGDDWDDIGSSFLSASYRFGVVGPAEGGSGKGFRVVSIPEPSTLLLGALGTIGLLMWRRSFDS